MDTYPADSFGRSPTDREPSGVRFLKTPTEREAISRESTSSDSESEGELPVAAVVAESLRLPNIHQVQSLRKNHLDRHLLVPVREQSGREQRSRHLPHMSEPPSAWQGFQNVVAEVLERSSECLAKFRGEAGNYYVLGHQVGQTRQVSPKASRMNSDDTRALDDSLHDSRELHREESRELHREESRELQRSRARSARSAVSHHTAPGDDTPLQRSGAVNWDQQMALGEDTPFSTGSDVGFESSPSRWAMARNSVTDVAKARWAMGYGPEAHNVSERFCSWQGVVCAVILTNTCIIALEAIYISSTRLRPIFEVAECSFTMFYVYEVGHRMRKAGSSIFFMGDDWNWNIFDLAITISGVADVAVPVFTGEHQHNAAGAGRLFRVLRILRLFRAGRFLRDVDQVLTMAFSATLKLVLVVSLVLFIFAIIATNLLWDAKDPEGAAMFQDLSASMWTLFRIMTLDNWVEMVGPVMHDDPDTRFFFVIFIFFGSIALLSLVPTIFIQLKMEQDERMRKRTEHRQEQKAQVRDHDTLDVLFTFLNEHEQSNGDGTIEMSTAQELLSDPDNPDLIHVARQRKLDFDELRNMVRDVQLGLFLLQVDYGDDDIELDEEDFHTLLSSRDTVDIKQIWRSVIECHRDHFLASAQINEGLESLRSDLKKHWARPPEPPEFLGELSSCKADLERLIGEKSLEVQVVVEASRAELAGLREDLAARQASAEAAGGAEAAKVEVGLEPEAELELADLRCELQAARAGRVAAEGSLRALGTELAASSGRAAELGRELEAARRDASEQRRRANAAATAASAAARSAADDSERLQAMAANALLRPDRPYADRRPSRTTSGSRRRTQATSGDDPAPSPSRGAAATARSSIARENQTALPQEG